MKKNSIFFCVIFSPKFNLLIIPYVLFLIKLFAVLLSVIALICRFFKSYAFDRVSFYKLKLKLR